MLKVLGAGFSYRLEALGMGKLEGLKVWGLGLSCELGLGRLERK